MWMWSLSLFVSQKVLFYKFKAFSILTKYLSHAVTVIIAAPGVTSKLVQIYFSLFRISRIEDLFLS